MNAFQARFRKQFLFICLAIFLIPLYSGQSLQVQDQKATVDAQENAWVEHPPIFNIDGMAGDAFGRSIAIDGNTAVVGDSSGIRDDAAYVYVRQGNEWVFQQKLTPSTVDLEQSFGTSVAIDGNTIVVGAPRYIAPDGYEPGVIYIFTREAEMWTEEAFLVPSQRSEIGLFGYGVAIDGDIVVAGDYIADVDSVIWQGNAFVFKRNGNEWTEQQMLIASDGVEYDQFGVSVDIDGPTIVVGMIGNHGAAYVFEEIGGQWVEQQKLTDTQLPDEYESFGISVAIDGSWLVVGNFLGDVSENINQGNAHLFQKKEGVWELEKILVSHDGAKSDYFGHSVDIDSDIVIVGAYLADINDNTTQGASYMYRKIGSQWVEEQKLIAQNGSSYDGMGQYVALDGNTAVMTARGADIGDNEGQGCIFVFERERNRRLFLPIIIQE